MEYNKLVRNKIPAEMRKKGQNPETHIAKDDQEFRKVLFAKAREEIDECEKDPTVEEFADIQEVLLALYAFLGITSREVESQRLRKRAERGDFTDRIILERVD